MSLNAGWDEQEGRQGDDAQTGNRTALRTGYVGVTGWLQWDWVQPTPDSTIM